MQSHGLASKGTATRGGSDRKPLNPCLVINTITNLTRSVDDRRIERVQRASLSFLRDRPTVRYHTQMNRDESRKNRAPCRGIDEEEEEKKSRKEWGE